MEGRKTKMKKKRQFKKICKICGKGFLGNAPTSRYCPECKIEHGAKIRHNNMSNYWEAKGKIRNKIGRTLVRILREKGYEHEQMIKYCNKAKVIHSQNA